MLGRNHNPFSVASARRDEPESREYRLGLEITLTM